MLKAGKGMNEFAVRRQRVTRVFLGITRRNPSSDTFRRVLCHIQPDAFLGAFLEWMKSVQEILPELVSVDGKTLRSAVKYGTSPLHIVNAWCGKNRMILGQVRNETKSNEITAIPKLLKQLILPVGCVITIDAAGTQKNIVAQIRDMKADYLLALKGNQPKLKEAVETYFAQASEAVNEFAPWTSLSQREKGVDEWNLERCLPRMILSGCSKKWVGMKSIIKVESTRWSGGVRQQENRYYITIYLRRRNS